jgi:hypothetical protein
VQLGLVLIDPPLRDFTVSQRLKGRILHFHVVIDIVTFWDQNGAEFLDSQYGLVPLWDVSGGQAVFVNRENRRKSSSPRPFSVLF